MTTERALMERVQHLKETYGIGTFQALKHIRIEKAYEPLRVKVAAEIHEQLSPDFHVSLEDVMEACDVLYRGESTLDNPSKSDDPHIPLMEYHNYVKRKHVNSDYGDSDKLKEAIQKLYYLFTAMYIVTKNSIRKTGGNSHEFQLFFDIKKITEAVVFENTSMREYDATDIEVFDMYKSDIRCAPFGQNEEVKEGTMPLYARAAIDGTLHISENERKIALNEIKAKSSKHLSPDQRINFTITLIKSDLETSIKKKSTLEQSNSIITEKPDTLVYRLLHWLTPPITEPLPYTQKKEITEETMLNIIVQLRKPFSIAFSKYTIKKDQYTLRAIEENREWLMKMLS